MKQRKRKEAQMEHATVVRKKRGVVSRIAAYAETRVESSVKGL